MKKENKQFVKDLAYFSSIGFQVSFSVIIGFFLGQYLDKKFGTDPWLMYVCLVMGIAAAVRNVLLAIKRLKKL
ncbi:MAG: AtpZ/AtpI family protein [Desulfobacterales bacterium]|nr:AtpZ/AtpI family protein [Desulfobacterales bacterium]